MGLFFARGAPKLGGRTSSKSGFTLIEISIVLVILGLIVGGVLAGQDLIKAAQVRATITQVEKFNHAVNTFYGKYGALPGDLGATAATQFGFVARAGTQARGDWNGLIEGYDYNTNLVYPWQMTGEPLFFWEDLSQANLIEGGFNTATDAGVNSTNISAYLPAAKLGGNNFFYVFSGKGGPGGNNAGVTAVNFFGLSTVTDVNTNTTTYNGQGLTVAQSYAIDQKVDDGIPNQGKVQAFFPGATGSWGIGWSPNAATPSTTTCFDTTSNQYSITQNAGHGVNCGLSFGIQGGD